MPESASFAHANRAAFPRASLRLALLLLPLLSTLLIYLPSLDNSFAWDDKSLVVNNPRIRDLSAENLRWAFTTTLGGNWMPLTWLSFLLDQQIGGPGPRIFHVTQLVLHILNTLWVLLLVRRLLDLGGVGKDAIFRWKTASLTALLFGIHPMHVESVAWVSERKDLLYAFFFLAAMHRHLAPRPDGNKGFLRDAEVLLLFALSLMSKPMAVTLPLVLLLLDFWPAGKRREDVRRRLLSFYGPAFLLSVAAAAAAVWAQGTTQAYEMAETHSAGFRILHACRSLLYYPAKMLAPSGLSALVPFPDMTGWQGIAMLLGSAAGAAFLTALAVLRRSRWPAFSVAWGYHVVTLLPVLGILQVGAQAVADRYTYLPGLAFLAGASWAVLRATRSRPLLQGALVAVVALALGIVTVRQTGYWKDSTTMWQRVVSVHPDRSAFAHENLAANLIARERFGEALREYDRALAVDPSSARASSGRGAALLALGRGEEAGKELQKTLRLDPSDREARKNLWILYGERGEREQALAVIREAVRLDPRDRDSRFRLAATLFSSGRIGEAEEQFRVLVGIDPKDLDARVNLGAALARQGRFEEAVREFEEARRLRPEDGVIEKRYFEALKRAGEKP